MNELLFSVFTLLFAISGYAIFQSRARRRGWHFAQGLPKDLDHYLATKESRYAKIVPNTEKTIIWYSPETKRQTAISIVFIHGYSASRQELSPLTENIAQRLKANLFLTRLTGHGQDANAMNDVSIPALQNDVAEAYEIGKKIGKKMILMGNSTGATLLTCFASNLSLPQVLGLILLSPNYGLQNKQSEWLLLPLARYWMPIFKGKHYEFVPSNERQAQYWTCKYPLTALVPMMKFVQMARNARLSNIALATLILYATEDQLIDNEQTKRIYGKLGSRNKKMELIHGAQGDTRHVIAGDILSPHTTQKVEEKLMSFISLLISDSSG